MAVCTVTARFQTAGGAPQRGVLVRFTPIEDGARTDGVLVAGEVTVESDADGEVSVPLLQELRVAVSVSHWALYREVRVPARTTATLQELVALTPDPLAPAEVETIDLPRGG